MASPVRVGINARLRDGAHGGVQQIVLGLVQGLREVGDPRVRPVLVVLAGEHDWLLPHIDPSWEVIELTTRQPPASQSPGGDGHGPPAVPRRMARGVRMAAERVFGRPVPVGSENPKVTRSRLDVVHFPSQSGWLTGTPSLYQPHDLQHEHLPRNFTPRERRNRRTRYGTLAHQAGAVVVGTSWVRDDVIDRLRVDAAKVVVVPVAPVDLPPPRRDRADLVTRPFLLYPAAPWPHKNHRRLLEAVALLRGRGIEVPTVLPGARVNSTDAIQRTVARLGLDDLVTLPGFVDGGTLALLYEHARAVCVPTLFESASFPVWEAFRYGCPVVASNVTSLPRQVGDAGLVVNPRSTTEVADAIAAVWTDDDLRSDLVAKGAERAKLVSLARSAQMFVALYLRLAGRPLSKDDEQVLREEPPL